jgi:DNA topoisomerase-1
MGNTLVIVESPTKVKTLSKFLGRKYSVRASYGHVRDLPKSSLGVDVGSNYTPKYINIRGKGDVIRELRDAAKKADKILLATDPDREGEAISWHLAQILKIDPSSTCRIEFNEITETAVKAALTSPRAIDLHRVDAQQARRVIDRLVGYNLSPFLWRKVRRGLSAGRVQSSALKLIADREREIQAFVEEEYWTLAAVLSAAARGRKFVGRYAVPKNKKLSADQVKAIVDSLAGATYTVKSVTVKEQVRRPAPPFITSTLQQEAFRKLGFSARRTMAVAQELYEGVDLEGQGHVGLITYMRTDSFRVASEAQAAARKYAMANYKFDTGRAVPEKPRAYRAKKGAQDAHEAIRPSDVWRTPESMAASLSRDQLKLYRLIWLRFLASQMSDAVFDATTVDIEAAGHFFRATGSVMKFPGFTAVYTEERDEDAEEERNQLLPELKEGQVLHLNELLPEQHFTQPPPRYTEASLVKELEKNGVGRPSTYAPIIETLRKRDYATLEQKRFKPTEVGLAVCDLLAEHFPSVVDLKFTAKIESELDKVADGSAGWVDVTEAVYKPLADALSTANVEVERVVIADEPTDELCPECGQANLVIKSGRYGKFVACPRYPDCTYRRSMAKKVNAVCPKCGGDMLERRSKKGRRFFGCANYPKCDFAAWNPPSGVNCIRCGAFTTASRVKAGTSYKCASPTCGHRWVAESGGGDE